MNFIDSSGNRLGALELDGSTASSPTSDSQFIRMENSGDSIIQYSLSISVNNYPPQILATNKYSYGAYSVGSYEVPAT